MFWDLIQSLNIRVFFYPSGSIWSRWGNYNSKAAVSTGGLVHLTALPGGHATLSTYRPYKTRNTSESSQVSTPTKPCLPHSHTNGTPPSIKARPPLTLASSLAESLSTAQKRQPSSECMHDLTRTSVIYLFHSVINPSKLLIALTSSLAINTRFGSQWQAHYQDL